MVRLAGLEPARLTALPPQSSVSANSTISAPMHGLKHVARTLQAFCGPRPLLGAHLNSVQGANLGSSLKGCPLNSRGCNPRKSVPRFGSTRQGSHYGTGKELNPWRGSDPGVTLPWVAPTAIHVQTLRVWFADGCRGCKKLSCALADAHSGGSGGRPRLLWNRASRPRAKRSPASSPRKFPTATFFWCARRARRGALAPRQARMPDPTNGPSRDPRGFPVRSPPGSRRSRETTPRRRFPRVGSSRARTATCGSCVSSRA